MTKLKVMTILGTRPEIIRLSRVIDRLDRHVDHKLVHTGQNYDYELNDLFFEDLGVRRPDYYLGSGGGTLGETIARIIMESERVITEERPDAVLILGDTNSAISAIMARRLKVPIYHMEAGNRSFDRNVPEETNRKIVDHIADFNLVYTEHARRHLLSEGIQHRRIYVTGSPMREIIDHHRDRIQQSTALADLGLEASRYFVASLHREENVDHPARLRRLLDALNSLAVRYDMPVVVSTHPRTRKRLEAIEGCAFDDRIRFLKPFGFFDYNHLQARSLCTISDSGTIAEESSILDFPAVTPRDAIERPEALDCGGIIASGLDQDAILNSVELSIALHLERASSGRTRVVPEAYSIDNTSERVLSLIVGSAKVSNAWDGIRSHEGS